MDLRVWQHSIQLTKLIYKTTRAFPKDEIYGLTSQMRRAAVSIASNIAEGSERNSTKEFQQFLAMAAGSLAELRTQLIIAVEIEYIATENASEIPALISDTSKMLSGLRKKLNG